MSDGLPVESGQDLAEPLVGPPQERPLVVAAGIDRARLELDPLLQFRPRGPVEIVGSALQLFGRNFGLFIGITAALMIPSTVSNMGFAAITQVNPLDPVRQLAALPSCLIAMFLGLIVRGAMIKAISDTFLGQPAGFRASYRYIGGRLGTFVVVQILVFLLTFGVLVLAMIPCVAGGVALAMHHYLLGSLVLLAGLLAVFAAILVVGVYLQFAGESVLIDGLSGMDALRRSKDLVTGHFWPVLAAVLLVGLLYLGVVTVAMMAPMAVSVAAGHAPSNVAMQGLSGLAMLFLLPVCWGVTTLLYYDLRIRKEAFDLEQLSASAVGFG